MTNKGKLTDRLTRISPELQSELNYYLNDVEHEEIPDYCIIDAFEDYVDIRHDDAKGKIRNEVNQILVDIGAYIPFVPAIVSTHKQKPDFTLNGTGYMFGKYSGWGDFINK